MFTDVNDIYRRICWDMKLMALSLAPAAAQRIWAQRVWVRHVATSILKALSANWSSVNHHEPRRRRRANSV
jgi:hypothetical protein